MQDVRIGGVLGKWYEDELAVLKVSQVGNLDNEKIENTPAFCSTLGKHQLHSSFK